jgi:hypothetical protein
MHYYIVAALDNILYFSAISLKEDNFSVKNKIV